MKINKLTITYENDGEQTGSYKSVFNTVEIDDTKMGEIEHSLVDQIMNFSIITELDIRKIIREELGWLWVMIPKPLRNQYQRNKSIRNAAKRIADLTRWSTIE